MLGVVGLRHVLAELDRARIGREQAVYELHERGLAGAVGAGERHVVAAVELEVHARVDVVLAEGLGDALEAHDLVSGARRLGEREVHLLGALGQDDELALDLLDLLHALLGLGGLRGLVAELVHEHLHVRDLALLGGALGPHLLEVVLALPEVAGVVGGVGGDAAVLHGGHMRDAGVHERPVVGDEKDRAVVAREELLEPADALEVEVVGRLVEQQQVGVAQQQLRERDAHLPAAREVAGGLVEVLDGEAETREDLPGARLELVAAEALEAVLRRAVALEQAVELVSGGGLGDLALELAHAALHLLHLVGGVHHLGKRALLAREVGLLLEVAHRDVAGEAHGALVGALLSHDDAQEGGLARAVGPDERPALPRVELQRGPGVEDPAAE